MTTRQHSCSDRQTVGCRDNLPSSNQLLMFSTIFSMTIRAGRVRVAMAATDAAETYIISSAVAWLWLWRLPLLPLLLAVQCPLQTAHFSTTATPVATSTTTPNGVVYRVSDAATHNAVVDTTTIRSVCCPHTGHSLVSASGPIILAGCRSLVALPSVRPSEPDQ